MIELSRRQALLAGAGVAMITVAPISARASLADDALAEMGFADAVESDLITLDLPEIAENGNTVPMAFSVDSPMTAEDHVTRVTILADGNPSPGVAAFNFTPMSGEAAAGTRIRMAGTQNIIAIAETSTGETLMAAVEVKVTIGGCGG